MHFPKRPKKGGKQICNERVYETKRNEEITVKLLLRYLLNTNTLKLTFSCTEWQCVFMSMSRTPEYPTLLAKVITFLKSISEKEKKKKKAEYMDGGERPTA